MNRQKPRYPMQLDNAFCDIAKHYECDTFSFEVWAVGYITLALAAHAGSDIAYEAIERMTTKIGLKSPKLPQLVVGVQTVLE